MPKPKKPPTPREDRGGRYCMVLELDQDDKALLEALVERYQKMLGPAIRASRVFVIRQLLRGMVAKKALPALR